MFMLEIPLKAGFFVRSLAATLLSCVVRVYFFNQSIEAFRPRHYIRVLFHSTPCSGARPGLRKCIRRLDSPLAESPALGSLRREPSSRAHVPLDCTSEQTLHDLSVAARRQQQLAGDIQNNKHLIRCGSDSDP